MNSQNLTERFQYLTKTLNEKKLEQARKEQQYEDLQTKQAEALKEIKDLLDVETIEKAEEKLKVIEAKIEKIASEAEALLSE